eukprot:SAG22_NODE_43_length_25304_cov_5.394644_18_plen_163_part_00
MPVVNGRLRGDIATGRSLANITRQSVDVSTQLDTDISKKWTEKNVKDHVKRTTKLSSDGCALDWYAEEAQEMLSKFPLNQHRTPGRGRLQAGPGGRGGCAAVQSRVGRIPAGSRPAGGYVACSRPLERLGPVPVTMAKPWRQQTLKEKRLEEKNKKKSWSCS